MPPFPSLHDRPTRTAACRHLQQHDPALAGCVRRYGDVWPTRPHSRFDALARIVLDQQLSVFAAASIRARLLHRLQSRTISAARLRAVTFEDLRSVGISRAKTLALLDLAHAEPDLRRLSRLSDEEVVGSLIRHRGIGPWSAQMVLLFVLGRPDVLAVADVGLQNAARRLYGLADRPSADQFARLAEPWRPFRSLASMYLWASLELGNWKSRPPLV